MTYEVMPRYTAGSPAMVDEHIALRVAEQEKKAYPGHLEGVYGDAWKFVAQTEGLDGIVVRSTRVSQYIDVITGREYGSMPYGAIRNFNTLYAKRGTRAVGTTYYFRRQVLVVLPNEKKVEDNHWRVLRALEEKFKMEPTGREVVTIWKNRVEL